MGFSFAIPASLTVAHFQQDLADVLAAFHVAVRGRRFGQGKNTVDDDFDVSGSRKRSRSAEDVGEAGPSKQPRLDDVGDEAMVGGEDPIVYGMPMIFSVCGMTIC